VSAEAGALDASQGLEDLNKFIRIGNRSLLIKGQSGTGKVTLALELASKNIDKFEIIFLSRKMSEHDFYNRFPWIKNFVKPENILSVSGVEPVLDDPSFTITNVISSIMNLTGRVEDPFVSLIERRRPFMILDAWDTISKEIDVPTRIRTEKLLISLTDKHIGFLVFLSEDLQASTMEYLVDGVVFLTQSFYKSYRLREMQLEKLKGTHIFRARVPFTLAGGRFRTFSSLSHKINDSVKKFTPILSNRTSFSSGNAELDEKLHGGFKRGTIISIEMDEDVDRFVFIPILAPLALNFISQGDAALVIPAADQHVTAVTRYLSPHADERVLKKYLRILGGSDSQSTGQPGYLVPRTDKTFVEAYESWKKSYFELSHESDRCLVTSDYSFVELEYQDQIQYILKSIIELSRLVRTSNNLLVMVSRPNYKSLEVMKSVSDIHLRIFEYDGATMLAAIKPQMFLYNIQTDYSQGFPSAYLLDST
jgi:KaiC/GvpD/RAD55 family RecA-like ATPase